VTKTCRTSIEYLRNADEQLLCSLPRDLDDAARRVALENGQRDILDALLPQLGLPKLAADEAPLAGIARLIARGGTAKQLDALRDSRRWLQDFNAIMRARHVRPRSEPRPVKPEAIATASPRSGVSYHGFTIRPLVGTFAVCKNREILTTAPDMRKARAWVDRCVAAAARSQDNEGSAA